MSKVDNKVLFTALAFLAVALKGKDAAEQESAQEIHKLAGLGVSCL